MSDFNALSLHVDGDVPSDASAAVKDEEEEMVVVADDHFTRCPISKEVFETYWDDEEGDMMLRNAVKVMVTETADPALYSLSAVTGHESIRYAIVNKKIVLDRWIETGKVQTLRNAVTRYSAMGKPEWGTELATAANESVEEDDVFVLLDAVKG